MMNEVKVRLGGGAAGVKEYWVGSESLDWNQVKEVVKAMPGALFRGDEKVWEVSLEEAALYTLCKIMDLKVRASIVWWQVNVDHTCLDHIARRAIKCTSQEEAEKCAELIEERRIELSGFLSILPREGGILSRELNEKLIEARFFSGKVIRREDTEGYDEDDEREYRNGQRWWDEFKQTSLEELVKRTLIEIEEDVKRNRARIASSIGQFIQRALTQEA